MRWLSIFFATVGVLATLSFAGAEELDGFRGIRWGTELASLKSEELVKVPAFKGIAPEMESYQRKGEELNLAGTRVENINYNFRKGKLVSVSIDFKGFFVYEKLTAYCRGVFGPATASMVKNMEYISTFEAPGTGVLLYLQLTTPLYSDGRLFFYSREVFD
jgi:hypothetical protein